MIPFVRKYKIEMLLAIFVFAFIVYFSLLSINRYLTFRSNYFDLGIMDQVVYNTSRGRILEMTNQDFHANASRFAIHFDPLLAFFAPLYLIFPDPKVLLVAQVIAVGLGAVFVYLIGKNLLKNKLYALMFAVSYLFYFPNQRAVLFDVHAVVFSTVFLLGAIYFSLVKKYRIMLLFILLSLFTKEHVGLITFLFGLYLFFLQKEKKYSFVVMIVSLIFFFTTFLYIIPNARQASHFALRYFEDLGDSPKSMVVNFFTKPEYIISKLTPRSTIDYLKGLFFPHIIFMVFAPFEFLIALPELAINVLSSSSNMRSIYFHYNAALVPFIYFSAIIGFRRMKNYVKQVRKQNLLIAAYIAANIFYIYKYAPLPFSFVQDPFVFTAIDTKKMNSIEEWQKKLADETIPVATTPQIAPFFTRRQYFYNFLYDTGYMGAGLSDDDIMKDIDGYKNAKYIVIAYSEVRSEATLSQLFYKKLKSDADYKVVYRKAGIIVYRR